MKDKELYFLYGATYALALRLKQDLLPERPELQNVPISKFIPLVMSTNKFERDFAWNNLS